MTFRISGLPAAPFEKYFAMTDAELAAAGAIRRPSDGTTPCRVSLTDAAPGEPVYLVNYEHHAIASPYRMRYAIYVRPGEERFDRTGEVPEQLRRRFLAARAFDADGLMAAYELVEGRALDGAIERLLADPRAAYLHLHFAAPGCYAARVDRA